MRCVLLAAAVLLAPLPAAASTWTVVPAESRLGFAGTQMGGIFEGRFSRFDASIRFDPEDLAASAVRVEVDVTSFDSQSPDRDNNVGSADWFDFAAFPTAGFDVSRITESADGGYLAEATLRIRSIERDVVLPFTFEIDGDRAKVAGELVLNRTDYDVGLGQWSTEAAVGFDVRVIVDLVLTRAQ